MLGSLYMERSMVFEQFQFDLGLKQVRGSILKSSPSIGRNASLQIVVTTKHSLWKFKGTRWSPSFSKETSLS